MSEDAPGCHVTGQVPLPPSGGEIVVHNSSRTGARVKDPIIARIDGNVIYSATLAGKQHQVAGTERAHLARQGHPSRGLLAGGAGKTDAVSAEHVLHET